jgi:hypothetical protein
MEALERELAARMTTHEDPTVQRALDLLGQGINPIKTVTPDGAKAIYEKYGRQPSDNMLAFRAPGDKTDPNIYINNQSQMFKDAAKDPLAQLLLAGTLAHEQVHNTDGEEAARRIESDFIRSKLGGLNYPQQQKAKQRIAGIEKLTK